MGLFLSHSVAHGSTILPILGLDTQTNAEIGNELQAGTPYPPFIVMRNQKPRFIFQSTQVADALALCGLTGVDVDATNNLVGHYAAIDSNNGLIDSGGTHKSYTCDRGLLFIRRLTCETGQDAVVDLEALVYSSDGSAHPITIGTAALPTLPRADERHTLGGITLAGKSIGCPTRLEIDFGSQVQSRNCGSNPYDEHLEQPGIQPIVTITGIDANLFAATEIPVGGIAGTHANSIIYLRQRNDDGIGFWPNVNIPPKHIKLDVDGIAHVVNHNGQGNSASDITVQFTPGTDSAGNAPIGINTASDIT